MIDVIDTFEEYFGDANNQKERRFVWRLFAQCVADELSARGLECPLLLRNEPLHLPHKEASQQLRVTPRRVKSYWSRRSDDTLFAFCDHLKTRRPIY